MKEPNNDLFATNLILALKDLMRYWYLLLISLVVAVAIAFFYLKFAAPSYKVQTSVLLNVNRGHTNPGRSDDIMQAFNYMEQEKSFQNEIAVLQSLPLIREVVNEMDLRTTYFLQEDRIPKQYAFSLRNIYNESPFIVVPDESHLQPVSMLFYIRIIDEERFALAGSSDQTALISTRNEQIVRNNVNVQVNGIYNFGDVIESDYYSFKVLINSNYDPARYSGKDLFFQFNNMDWVAQGYKGRLAIETVGIESHIAQLVFTTDNIQKGNDFLNALISKYVERNLEESNFLAEKTIEYIDNQLVNITDSLGTSERQLQSLRSNYSVMNIEEKAQNLNEQIQAAENERDEAQRRLNHLEQMIQYFESNTESSELIAPSSFGLNDPLLNNLIGELTTLNSEKQRIISQDQLRNPRLQTIDISIDNLKRVITENLNFSITTSRRQIDETAQKLNELNRELSRLPATQRRLQGVERSFNLNDAVYTSLLERRIQAQILKASRLPDLKIIEPPGYMTVASPSRMIVLFLAIFLGLAFPIIFILGKRLIFNRIHHSDEIKAITGIPIIGNIHHSPKSEQNIVLNYPRSAVTEAFQSLRSNIVYYLLGKKNRIIQVTSTLPGEGKTFTALNLATSFAFTNNRTVIVAFDMRRPSLSVGAAEESKSSPGLSSYLIDRAKLEDIIVQTDIPNLDMIGAGEIPPNPIELISSVRTNEMMEKLKEMYDYIIIDTPPYGMVTDAFLLMQHADIKLYITRLGLTRKRVFASVIDEVAQKSIENIYLMVNDVRKSQAEYSSYTYDENYGRTKRSRFRNVLKRRKKRKNVE